MSAPLTPNNNRRASQTTDTNANSALSSNPQVRISNTAPVTVQGTLPAQSRRQAALQSVRRQLQQSSAAVQPQSSIAQRYLDRAPVIGTQNLPELVTQPRAFFRDIRNMQQYVTNAFPMDQEGTDMVDFNQARADAVVTPEMRAAQRLALEPVLRELGFSRIRGTREIEIPSSFDPRNSILLTTQQGHHCLMQVIRSLYLLDNVTLAQNLSDVLREVQRRYPQVLTINNALLLSTAPSDNFWQAVNAINTRTAMPLPPPFDPARNIVFSILSFEEHPVGEELPHRPSCNTGNLYFNYIYGQRDAAARYLPPIQHQDSASDLRARMAIPSSRLNRFDLDLTDVWAMFPANTPLAKTPTGPDLDALFRTYPLISDVIVQVARSTLSAIGYRNDAQLPAQFPPASWMHSGVVEQELWAVQYILHSISQIAPAQAPALVSEVQAQLSRPEAEPYNRQLQPLLAAILDPNNIPAPDFPDSVRLAFGMPLLGRTQSGTHVQPAVQPLQPVPPQGPQPIVDEEIAAYHNFVNSSEVYVQALSTEEPAIFESFLPELLSTIFPLATPSTLHHDAPTLSHSLNVYIQAQIGQAGGNPQDAVIVRWLQHCGIDTENRNVINREQFQRTMLAEDTAYQMQFHRILAHLSATGRQDQARALLQEMLGWYPENVFAPQPTLNAWCGAVGISANECQIPPALPTPLPPLRLVTPPQFQPPQTMAASIDGYTQFLNGELYRNLILAPHDSVSFSARKDVLIGALFPLERPSRVVENDLVLNQPLLAHLTAPANSAAYENVCRSVIERFFIHCGLDVARNQFRHHRLRRTLLNEQDTSYRINMNRIVTHLTKTGLHRLATHYIDFLEGVLGLTTAEEPPLEQRRLNASITGWREQIEQARTSAGGRIPLTSTSALMPPQRVRPPELSQTPQFRHATGTTQPSATGTAGAGAIETGTGPTAPSEGAGPSRGAEGGDPSGTGGPAGAGGPPPPPPRVRAPGTATTARNFDHITVSYSDVTAFRNGCIVNAANGELQRGAGVCAAIFTRAGDNDGAPALVKECDDIIAKLPQASQTQSKNRGLPPGAAVITSAPGARYREQNVSHIIHTVGPNLQTNTHYTDLLVDERGSRLPDAPIPPQARLDLIAAYRRTYELAVEHGVQNLALPVISGGIYGYETMSSFREGINIASEPEFRGLNITFCFWNPFAPEQARQLSATAATILQQTKDAENQQNQGATGS
ncbi:MAG: macro domain-containing protein [Vibrionaceae bacterium]